MKPTYHFVARALPFLTPFKNREGCVDVWKRLRAKFPDIAACTLMPNHLHLLVVTADPELARLKLCSVLSSWTKKRQPGRAIWQRIPDGQRIPDVHHLKRQIRYVHLNPCRAGLVSDPLSWEWSTHRDFTDCVADPWPRLSEWARVFKISRKHLAADAHRYISSDPSVSVTGSPLMQDYRRGEPLVVDTQRLLLASAVVLRRQVAPPKRGPVRNLAVKTAQHLNLKFKPEEFGLSRNGLYKILQKQMDIEAVHKVLRVTQDPRCRPCFTPFAGDSK